VRNRRGFSLTELLIVVAIVAMVTRLSLPKLNATRDRNALRAAKLQVASYIATARAAAIRRSQPAQFFTSSSTAWATVGTTSRSSVSGTIRLTNLKVAVSSNNAGVNPANDSILFDARGMASNLGGTRVYRLSRNNLTDSICVSRLGLITRFC